MKVPYSGAIDCDVHPSAPTLQALLPYLDEYWREQIVNRHIDQLPFKLTSYPPNSPLSARPDWRTEGGMPAGDLEEIRRHVLEPFGLRYAVCNILHGAVALFNDDMAAALCSAVNDWTAKELLDREPRLRASIVVPFRNPELVVAEVERVAADRRFVQVLVWVMGEMLLGRRQFWPVYAAAERHGLAVGIHAGSTYQVAPTPAGWPSHRVEDYVLNANAFENQIVSLLAEGVFQKFPELKFVLMESGFAWLPTLMWRTGKLWRGVRPEIPWLDRAPLEILRDQVRLTLQPVDLPPGETDTLARTFDHIGSESMLLFSTDFPHWQFDGDEVLPDGLTDSATRRILVDNPLETYPRLRNAGGLGDNEAAKAESVR